MLLGSNKEIKIGFMLEDTNSSYSYEYNKQKICTK